MAELIKLSVNKNHKDIVVFHCVVRILLGTFDRHEIILHQQDARALALASVSPEDDNVYVTIDTDSHEAFGHWFFESFSYIEELLRLKKIFPKISIYIFSERNYKLEFLKLFGFNVVTEIKPDNKILLMPRVTSLNLNENVYDFKNRLITFKERIKERIETTLHHVDTVMIPRQLTGNYANNDRTVDSTKIESIISKKSNSFIIDSSKKGGIFMQCALVASCNTLIVPDGSGFLVNGFLANNAQIIVLGSSLILRQALEYDKIAVILEMIRNDNDIIFINRPSNHFEWNDIAPFVDNTYESALQVMRKRKLFKF